MAESAKSNQGGGGKRSGGGSSSSNSKRDKPSLREVVESAKEQLGELLGRPVESVLGIEQGDDEWQVTIEVLELSRVPSTTDVLGKYLVAVDEDGEVTGVTRTRRYNRAEAGED